MQIARSQPLLVNWSVINIELSNYFFSFSEHKWKQLIFIEISDLFKKSLSITIDKMIDHGQCIGSWNDC